MIELESNPASAWHSPERAWTPLMWIISAVAFSLSAMVLAPLAPVMSAANGTSASAAAGPDAALVDAAKALAQWSASATSSAAPIDRLAKSGASTPPEQ